MSSAGHRAASRHTGVTGATRRTHGSLGFDPTVSAVGNDVEYYPVAEQVTSGDISPGAVGPGTLAPGAISDLTPFASSIRPVAIVATLPALPDALYPPGSTVVLTTDGKLYRNVLDVWTASVASADGGISPVASLPVLPSTSYPVGSFVYLTTDGKLYRNVANAWTAAVPTTDLTGQITETQITDLAISTPKLAANAVTAAKIAAGTITAAEIAADTITANQIAAGAISASELAANSVVAGKIAAGTITAAEIAADTITGGQIAAGAISASEIAAGAITATKLAVGGGRYLTNPDFETGDFTGWSSYDWGTGGSTAIGADPVWRAQGRYYAQLISGTGVYGLWQDVGGFHYNDYLQIGALMANSGSAYFRVQWLDQAGAAISQQDSSAYATGGGYGGAGPTRFTAKLGPAPAGTVTARLWVINNSIGATLIVDDIWLSRVGDLVTPDGNVLINSSGVAITGGKLSVVDSAGQTSITGGAIAARSVTADKLVIGAVTAKNLLVNGGFRRGTSGWNYTSNGAPGWQFTVWYDNTTWTLRDGDVDGWTSTKFGSTALMSGAATADTFYPYIFQGVRVTPGEFYSLSALLGIHRLTEAKLEIDWWTAEGGTFIGSAFSTIYTSASLTGGSSKPAYEFATIEGVQAPTNATFCNILIVGRTPNTSGTDWYLFMDQVCFVAGKVAQAYVPGESYETWSGDGSVLINSSGVAITNGKLTVSNPAATVIIDGTSNMFKIAASGTISVSSVANNSSGLGTVTVTGAAPGSVLPAFLVSTNEGAIAARQVGNWLGNPGLNSTATGNYVDVQHMAQVRMMLSGTVDAQVRLECMNYSGVTRNYSTRYYILKEAGI